jgi:hypothetical protein
MNGSELAEPGTRYEVDSEGDLVLFIGDIEALRIPVGDWMEVRAVGMELAPDWPPADLELLLSNVGELLGVRYGDYVHGLQSTDTYQSPLLNDLDALVEAMLTRVGIDAGASENRDRIDDVRDLVRRHFHLSTDEPRNDGRDNRDPGGKPRWRA